MKFDVIVGNPPFSGSKRHLHHEFFIKYCKQCNKILTFIAPTEMWLNSASQKTRDAIEKLMNVHILRRKGNPWSDKGITVDVMISLLSHDNIRLEEKVFKHNGRYVVIENDVTYSLLKKITQSVKKFGSIKFHRGGQKEDVTQSEKDYVIGYVKNEESLLPFIKAKGKHSQAVQKLYDLHKSHIVLYCELSGDAKNIFRKPKGIISTQNQPLLNDRFVVFPTNNPEKLVWWLSHDISRFVHMKFHASMHLGKDMQNLVPDIHELLPDNVDEREEFVMSLLELTKEEREITKL